MKSAHRLLVQPDDPAFVESVARRLAQTQAAGVEPDAPDAAIERAIQFVFSLTLHDAFLRDGSAEQERAFHSAQALVHPALRDRVGDEALAADLTQQALGQAWEMLRRKPVEKPGYFSYYLFRIGMNLVVDHIRGPEAGNARLVEDDWPDEPPDGRAGVPRPMAVDEMREVERALEDTERSRLLRERIPGIVRRCLERWDRYRRVIEEHLLRGRSYPELVRAWGCTAASLSMDKFYGLSKLRRCPEMIRFLREELWLPTGGRAGEP